MNDPIAEALHKMFKDDETSCDDNSGHAGNNNSDSVEQVQTAGRQSDFRPVSPTFLQALGLMNIADLQSTVIVRPVKSLAPGISKDNSGSSSFASGASKRSQAKAVGAKAPAVKKGRVTKAKAQAKKRNYKVSVDQPEEIPVVAAKKGRKTAAPAAAKSATKKQHKATPRAREASDASNDSIVEADVDKLETMNLVDKSQMWNDILESDFESSKFTALLKKAAFDDRRVNAIQKICKQLCYMFNTKPQPCQRYMKTYKCTECHYSIAHECVRMNTSEFWPFSGCAPGVEYFQPESPFMCSCNFVFFHSHNAQIRAKREPEVSSTMPKASGLVENYRSLTMDCYKCCMNMAVTKRASEVCPQYVNFISTDHPLRKKFYNFVLLNVEFNEYLPLGEFWGCDKLCCMIYHRCVKEIIQENIMPIQPRRPFNATLIV